MEFRHQRQSALIWRGSPLAECDFKKMKTSFDHGTSCNETQIIKIELPKIWLTIFTKPKVNSVEIKILEDCHTPDFQMRSPCYFNNPYLQYWLSAGFGEKRTFTYTVAVVCINGSSSAKSVGKDEVESS